MDYLLSGNHEKAEINSDHLETILTEATKNMPTYIYTINNIHHPKGLKKNMSCLYTYAHSYSQKCLIG